MDTMRKHLINHLFNLLNFLKGTIIHHCLWISGKISELAEPANKKLQTGFILYSEKVLAFGAVLFISTALGSFAMLHEAGGIWLVDQGGNWLYAGIVVIGVGMVMMFVSGFIIVGIVLVSVGRLLLLLRDIARIIWKDNTPRYIKNEYKYRSLNWPPHKNEIKNSYNKAKRLTIMGTILFVFFTSSLVGLEFLYPDKLHSVLNSVDPSWLSKFLTANLIIIDLEGVARTANLSASSVVVVGSIFMFVIPGIFFTLAARNYLFVSEAQIRENLEESRGSVKSLASYVLYDIVVSVWLIGIILAIWQT